MTALTEFFSSLYTIYQRLLFQYAATSLDVDAQGKKKNPLQWLFAPKPSSIGFALRTTCASLMALAIALWMELGSPQWAAMTVWIVAQGSRGESISKAKWRIVGTAMGFMMSITLISAFNQMAWLFFPTLGLWVGLCCTLATLARNFRAYAMVLSGYTTVIISTGAIPHPDNVFMTAMSRVSYIILGIICEGTLGAIFSYDVATSARNKLRDKIRTALSETADSVSRLLKGDKAAIEHSYALFDIILSINNRIEFSEVEMGPHGHEGDHARAALATVSVILSRGLGMSARLQDVPTAQPIFHQTAIRISRFLSQIPLRLKAEEDVSSLQEDIKILRAECHQKIIVSLTQEVDRTMTTTGHERVKSTDVSYLVDGRMLHTAVDELLGEFSLALQEYEAAQHFIPRDHFQFKFEMRVNKQEALLNGIRAFIAVNGGGLVWECTAWPSGLGFITFNCVVCALFAARENPVVASIRFMIGGLWAAIVSFFLDFVILPAEANYEMLAASMALPMFAGGLAARDSKTALPAASYTMLMPMFVHPMNHGRWNEIEWFNSTSAILLGISFAVMVFRAGLPFNVRAERDRMRSNILHDLRILAGRTKTPSAHGWTAHNIERFARIIRHAEADQKEIVNYYLQGILAAMTIGLNIIRLRHLLARSKLPSNAHRIIEIMLKRISEPSEQYRRLAQISHTATLTLRRTEANALNISVRIELTRAIAYLIVITHELQNNEKFLSQKHFIG